MNKRRAVYEQFWRPGFLVMLICWAASLAMLADVDRSSGRPWIPALLGLIPLLVRRRIAADLVTRTITIHWVLSLAPGLPALELRWLMVYHLMPGGGIGLLFRTRQVRQDGYIQIFEEHVVCLVPEQPIGAGKLLGGLNEVVILSDKLIAAEFGQQLAGDLGLAYRGDLTPQPDGAGPPGGVDGPRVIRW